MDHLGLEQAVDRLGEGVVVGVADAADGGLDAGLSQPLRVAQREVLRPAVAVMHEPAALERPALVQGLLQGIEHEAGMGGARHAPADDPAGERVDDEGVRCRSRSMWRRR